MSSQFAFWKKYSANNLLVLWNIDRYSDSSQSVIKVPTNFDVLHLYLSLFMNLHEKGLGECLAGCGKPTFSHFCGDLHQVYNCDFNPDSEAHLETDSKLSMAGWWNVCPLLTYFFYAFWESPHILISATATHLPMQGLIYFYLLPVCTESPQEIHLFSLDAKKTEVEVLNPSLQFWYGTHHAPCTRAQTLCLRLSVNMTLQDFMPSNSSDQTELKHTLILPSDHRLWSQLLNRQRTRA